MWRVAVFLSLLFFILMMLRALRQLLESFFGPPGPPPKRGEVAGEMVRDPVCGTWIDRRLALPVDRGSSSVAVCSEKCRHALESKAR
jgi:hypothetical protein